MEITESSRNEPLYSEFADDEDMRELLEMFVGQLSERACGMSEAFQTDDPDQLKTLAHQLKGAAGSYGFGSISERCGELEQAVLSGASPEDVREALERVVDLCERATHLPPA